MTPVDDSRNAYTVTTDKFAAGDSFGFAVVEAGCTIEDESICVSEPGSDDAPQICKEQELCDHRYDVGTAEYTTQIDEPEGVGHDRTCWDGSTRCSSASPFHDLPMEQRSCLRDPHDAWLNRVLSPDMEATGAVSAVWGSCETSPSAEFKCADASNPPAASSMCPDLERSAVERQNAVNTGCDGKPDGSFCSMTHTAPGVESVAVSSTCCAGACCPVGETCNVAGVCEAPADNSVCATNGGFPSSGICTDHSVEDRISPGFQETDCDRTCQSAVDKSGGSAHLTCVIGATDDANKCRCSPVAGHTPSECMFHPGGPNYKCSVCQTVRTVTDETHPTVTQSGQCEFQGGASAALGQYRDVLGYGAARNAASLALAENGDVAELGKATSCTETKKKNIEYLDRHRLSCDSGELLHSFKLDKCGGNNMKYTYRCEDVPQGLGSCRTIETGKSKVKGKKIEYLDRFNTRCRDNEALSTMRMKSDGDKLWYKSTCCQISTGENFVGCATKYTGWNEGEGKQNQYLDRHNVNCPNGEVMKGFQIERSGKNIRYNFECCDIPGHRSPPPPPPPPPPSPPPPNLHVDLNFAYTDNGGAYTSFQWYTFDRTQTADCTSGAPQGSSETYAMPCGVPNLSACVAVTLADGTVVSSAPYTSPA